MAELFLKVKSRVSDNWSDCLVTPAASSLSIDITQVTFWNVNRDESCKQNWLIIQELNPHFLTCEMFFHPLHRRPLQFALSFHLTSILNAHMLDLSAGKQNNRKTSSVPATHFHSRQSVAKPSCWPLKLFPITPTQRRVCIAVLGYRICKVGLRWWCALCLPQEILANGRFLHTREH